jgi:hypothetical protein
MRYLALATDYDGTLAHHGRVDGPTLAALERLLASGRKLILVTGRELDDLRKVFDHFRFFEWVVAENGAVLYRPATNESVLLAEPPPARFAQMLRERGVAPVSTGAVVEAPGTPTKLPYWRSSATWAWNCRSSSTRTRSWCCRPTSTRRPACWPS